MNSKKMFFILLHRARPRCIKDLTQVPDAKTCKSMWKRIMAKVGK